MSALTSSANSYTLPTPANAASRKALQRLGVQLTPLSNGYCQMQLPQGWWARSADRSQTGAIYDPLGHVRFDCLLNQQHGTHALTRFALRNNTPHATCVFDPITHEVLNPVDDWLVLDRESGEMPCTGTQRQCRDYLCGYPDWERNALAHWSVTAPSRWQQFRRQFAG